MNKTKYVDSLNAQEKKMSKRTRDIFIKGRTEFFF